MDATRADRERWAARRGAAQTLRAVVFLGPVLLSFLAAWGLTRVWPPSSGALGHALHLVALVTVSTVVLVLLDKGARRLLPLVTLLDLSLLFPKAAPSRLAVAREAIRRRPIEDQLARVREAGADPSIAAKEILALVAALSRHDRPTRGHAERVRMFTDLIAEQMRIPERDRDLLRWAAILHDIGKLRVPTAILNKPGKPDDDEWAALQAHPTHGADIASGLLPWLGEWGDVIVQHHERWDGTGYPEGLSGREISLGSRIVSVADAYDVMTSARAYKRPVSRAAAYQELIRFSGSQFDPIAVRAMVSVSAPRLRRAQGFLSWLADVPLVATHAVPATTLARAVGAGAVATGAVTGTVLAPPPEAAPNPTTVVAEAVPGTADEPRSRRTGRGSTGEPAAPPSSSTSTRPEPRGPERPPSAPATVAPAPGAGRPAAPDNAAPAPTAVEPPPSEGGGGTGSGTTAPTSGSSGSGSSGSGSSGSGSLGDTVDDVTGGLTGTVDGVTGGVVDDTTDVVDETVDDVTDTVDDVTGGLVGGLLGR